MENLRNILFKIRTYLKKIHNSYPLYTRVIYICLTIILAIWVVIFILEATEITLKFIMDKLNDFFVPIKYPRM